MADYPFVSRLPRWTLPDREWLSNLYDRMVIQWSVIYAVIMRESRTRYGNSDLGYFWAVFDPLVELSILIFIFTLMGRGAAVAMPLPVFFAMGLLPFNFMRGSITQGSSAVKANQPLLTYPQVKVVDLVLGRVILEFATLAIVYILFMIGADLILGIPFTYWYDQPLGMSVAVCTLFFMGVSLALLSSSLTRLFPAWPGIWSYLSRPLWFLSAIFYTLEALPHGPRQYIAYNPLAHVVEWFRSASSPVMNSHAFSPMFVYETALIVIFLGLGIDRLLTWIGYSDRTS